MTSVPQDKGRTLRRVALWLAVLYTLAFAFSYLPDPLALAPQLDAQENLVLAAQFDTGSIPPEPFYRAVLYPWLLSHVSAPDNRPLAGLLLGLACHLVNGLLVHRLAALVWRTRGAPVVAAVLYLVNPASLFFALQVLDITLATSLFLGGLWLGLRHGARPAGVVGAGVLFGLAVLARPHFLLAALAAPPAIMLLSLRRSLLPALAWLPLAVLLLLQGALNLHRAHDFRILPWQGAYNLWAANRPGANGLYFKQAIDLSGAGEIGNPTRMESVLLYGQAHPEETRPYAIAAMNDYWRGKFLAHLRDQPLDVARLWLFKAYAVLNSFEQYNNLTFAFHRQRLALLRYNPLNWGILLVAGSLGLLALWKQDRRTAAGITLLLAAYGVMLLLFFASARFRLPLVPLTAVLAGGACAWVKGIFHYRTGIAVTLAVAAAAGFAAWSPFGGIRATDTFVQDRLLLANACASLGRDAEAARHARDVLVEFPARREAQRIYTLSYFNLQAGQSGAAEPFGGWEAQRAFVTQEPPTDPAQDVVLGIYFWKWGERERAAAIWRAVADSGAEARLLAKACLGATGLDTRVHLEALPLQKALAPLLQ